MHTGRTVIRDVHVPPGSSGLSFERADIEIHGVDQSGPSFEIRVFLNNPEATLATAQDAANGYAGAVHVYGYGVWPDDVGKTEAERDAAAAGTIRAPMEKVLIATEQVRAALTKGPSVAITLAPLYTGDPAKDAGDALKFEGVDIVIR